MQIGEESIENLLVNMVLEKKKNTDLKRPNFMPLYLGMN